MNDFAIKWIRPAFFALLAATVAGVAIVTIGTTLLNAVNEDVTSELQRKELWLGIGLTVAILAVASFLSKGKPGEEKFLDEPVAIGSTPMFDLPLPPVDHAARSGEPGTLADLGAGYTLYASSGALATVVDVLKSVEDIGGRTRTLIYGTGLYGVDEELWIPVEAVTGVYPETHSAFLAIRGDEINQYGWNRPPAAFSRNEQKTETPLY